MWVNNRKPRMYLENSESEGFLSLPPFWDFDLTVPTEFSIPEECSNNLLNIIA